MHDEEDEHFRELVLDDNFVSRAANRELSAEERARLTRDFEKAEAKRRKAESRADTLLHRTGRKIKQFRGVAVLATVLITLAIGAIIDPFEHSPLHRGDDTSVTAAATDMPTATEPESETPLGRPAASTTESRSYKFIGTQPDSSQPIAYDPCRPIAVVLNLEDAPAEGERMVRESLNQVSLITGLQFRIEGTTTEQAADQRQLFQSSRYGDRWAPVLIAWTNPDQLSDLEDDTAGIAGSGEVEGLEGDKAAYVSGQVALDGPQIEEIIDDRGWDYGRAVVMHEVGHLVGLDHVDDDTQLMYPTDSEVTTFQAGDRNGLVQLGQGTCFKDL